MISPEVPIDADAAIRLQGASERGTRSDGPGRLLFTTYTSMGRTLHYELRGDRPIPIDAWSEIELAQRFMNDRFTWTCENLGLGRHDDGAVPEEFRRHDRFRLRAWGFTKVADDEWNALLVVRFLTWVSRRLPAFTVTLHDEGDHVLAGHILLRKGAPKLDVVGVEDSRDYLEEHRLAESIAGLDDAGRVPRRSPPGARAGWIGGACRATRRSTVTLAGGGPRGPRRAAKRSPMKVVQELLGHADVRMTLRYAHLAPVAHRDAVEVLARPHDRRSLGTIWAPRQKEGEAPN